VEVGPDLNHVRVQDSTVSNRPRAIPDKESECRSEYEQATRSKQKAEHAIDGFVVGTLQADFVVTVRTKRDVIFSTESASRRFWVYP